MDADDDLMNLSTISSSVSDDSKDVTYINEGDSDIDSNCEEDFGIKPSNIVEEKKYICYESMLTDVFIRLKCTKYDSPFFTILMALCFCVPFIIQVVI